MKKILFPTEFSRHSPQVFKYALELAKQFDATLVAMHVYPTAELIITGKQEKMEIANQMMDVLKDFIDKNKGADYKDVKMEYLIDTGLPAEDIVEVSLDENIGLIVMGMTGKNDAIDKFFGTISSDVITNADCPVLAIPASYEFKNPKKLVYTTDFMFRDLGVLNTLKDWAKIFKAKINCLHIVEQRENELTALVNMGMLRDTFKSKRIPQFDCLTGNVAAATLEYLNHENADMVVMLSRKRNLFQKITEGSQAKKLAQKINIPILIFKGNAYETVPRAMNFTGFSVA